ncbi:DNA helicase [Bertholletia excelsa]
MVAKHPVRLQWATENSRPEFNRHPIRSICGKITTLQVCLDTKCLLLQLLHMHHLPESIKCFLADPVFTFVGMDIHHNITKLCNEYGLACSKMVDIRALAKTSFPISFHKPGLKTLADEVLGLYMEKPMDVCRSNWEARVFDERQIEYACIDAYASCRIGARLLDGN